MPLADMLVLFVLGAILGSFINALVFRYNTGKSMWGRSGCLSCGRELSATELVPVFSYLFLRGRCSTCGSRISLQYPIVELLSGVLVVLCWDATGTPLIFTATLAYFELLLFIAVYDMRHTIIPDSFVVGAGLIALALSGYLMGLFGLAWALVAGASLAAPILLLWLVSRGRWVGLGDAKLFFCVGAFLGLLPGIAAFLIAFWIGALCGLALIGLSKLLPRLGGVTMKSEVPFGPYIIAATAIVYFFNLSLYDLVISL